MTRRESGHLARVFYIVAQYLRDLLLALINALIEMLRDLFRPRVPPGGGGAGGHPPAGEDDVPAPGDSPSPEPTADLTIDSALYDGATAAEARPLVEWWNGLDLDERREQLEQADDPVRAYRLWLEREPEPEPEPDESDLPDEDGGPEPGPEPDDDEDERPR